MTAAITSRRIRPFRIVLVASTLIGLSLALPNSARAQVPTFDEEANVNWALNLLGRLGEWYLTASEWRDAMNARINELHRRTRQVARIRTKYEHMAEGELGRLGDYIPDWREYANHCKLEAEGVSICEVDNYLARRFDRLLQNTFYKYQSRIFSQISEVRRDIDRFIGREVSEATGWAEERWGGTHLEHLGRTQPIRSVQAESAPHLEQIAQRINDLLDNLTEAELNDPMSSGRARQLAAHLSYMDAVLELNMARARVHELDARIIAAADAVREQRSTNFMRNIFMP